MCSTTASIHQPATYMNAETLTGFRTAAEFPSLNLYATRYGCTFGPLFALSVFSLGTIGLPKKSIATWFTLKGQKCETSQLHSTSTRQAYGDGDTDLVCRLVVLTGPLRNGLRLVRRSLVSPVRQHKDTHRHKDSSQSHAAKCMHARATHPLAPPKKADLLAALFFSVLSAWRAMTCASICPTDQHMLLRFHSPRIQR